MSQSNYLASEKPSILLIKFSIPCVMSLLISALYNIVDQVFIGNSNVGTIGNTATSICYPIICIALAFSLMLGDGSASYMSLSLGRKENDKLSKIFGSGFIVSFIISILFVVLSFLFLDNILYLLGARNEEALNASREYAIWIIIGMPFFILSNYLNPIIRADGSPKIAMIANIAGCLINIVLDYIFIFPMNMGLTGAALATTIGIVISLLISLIYILKPKNFTIKLNNFIPDKKILWEEIKLGFSSFLTQLSIVIISVVSMNILAKYGVESKYGANDPQAIIGVVMKVFSIFVNIAVGVACGAQPIIGFNYGAKLYDRVKQVFKYVVVITIIVGVVATILFQTIPVSIIKIFGSNSKNKELYLEFGELAIRIYLSLIILTLLQKVFSIFLQSIESPIKSTLLSLIREVIVFVPVTIILPIFFGVVGMLWAAPIADIIGIIFGVIFVKGEISKMRS